MFSLLKLNLQATVPCCQKLKSNASVDVYPYSSVLLESTRGELKQTERYFVHTVAIYGHDHARSVLLQNVT